MSLDTHQGAIQKAEDASELCKNCGLCCTGHIFPKARSFEDEIPLLELLGLEHHRDPHKNKLWFSLPCAQWNGKCDAYENRPSTCSRFACDLLVKLNAHQVTLRDALSLTSHIGSLGTRLQQEIMPDVPPPYFDRPRLQRWIQEGLDKEHLKNPSLFIDAIAYERAVRTHLQKASTQNTAAGQNKDN